MAPMIWFLCNDIYIQHNCDENNLGRLSSERRVLLVMMHLFMDYISDKMSLPKERLLLHTKNDQLVSSECSFSKPTGKSRPRSRDNSSRLCVCCWIPNRLCPPVDPNSMMKSLHAILWNLAWTPPLLHILFEIQHHAGHHGYSMECKAGHPLFPLSVAQ